jgi:ketosteroid isomerase-like protein
MHSLRTRLLAGLCVLTVPLVACERQPDGADVEAGSTPPAGVAAARDRWVAGWNGDDTGAVSLAYVDDATATIGDDTYSGRAEIEVWVRDNIVVVSDLQLTPTSGERAGDDWREEGTYTHLTSPPDVEPFMAEGRYTITWTSDEKGDWWIRSTDIQPNPPPES